MGGCCGCNPRDNRRGSNENAVSIGLGRVGSDLISTLPTLSPESSRVTLLDAEQILLCKGPGSDPCPGHMHI